MLRLTAHSAYVFFSTRIAIFLTIQLFALTAVAQTESGLEQSISVTYNNESLENILHDISEQTGVEFSYSSEIVKGLAPITYTCSNEILSTAINEILAKANLQYSLVGKHLVIKQAVTNTPTPTKKKSIARFTIRGFVIDAHSKEALIGAAVYNPSTGLGTLTNNFGYFSISLPIGDYELEISYIGYTAIRNSFSLTDNTTWNASLNPMASFVEEVIVTSENKEEIIFKSLAAQNNLKPFEITNDAAALGETDMLKSLDKLPGISFQGDGSSYFYVRGGNRDQNLILLDDAPIYNPSHMLGLFTPIIPEAVKNTNVYKADFPIQYGGRLSSVIDIRTRDGNKEHFSGSANMGLVSTRLSLEGPIKKNASSYFISYRRSYFGWIFKNFNPSIKDFYFTDFTTKLNLKLSDKDRLFLTFYHGKDQFLTDNQNSTLNGVEWTNTSLTLRWNHIFADRLFLNTTINTGKYAYYLHTDHANNLFWNSTIRSSHLKTEFTYYANPQNHFRFGMKVGGYFFNPGNYNGPEIGIFQQVSELNSSEVILYAGNEHHLNKKILLNYGLRLSLWQDIGEAYIVNYQNYEPVDLSYYESGVSYYSKAFIEPRISVSYKLGTYSSIKASYNRTNQNIHLINNSISPFNTLEVWLPSGPNIKPQTANIYNLGILHSWKDKSIDFTADIYHKTLYNQIGYIDHADLLLNAFMEGELRQGNGKAYGFEVYVKKNMGKLTWQAGYGYTRSFVQIDGLNNNEQYRARQDKPIELSASLGYFFKPRWLMSGNYTLTSGMVTTTPTGFYNYRGSQVPIYAKKNNDRLPNYSRFDLASDFRLNKNASGPIEHHLIVSLYNMFWKKNAAFYYFSKAETEEGNFVIPSDKLAPKTQITTYRYIYSIIPSISYNLKF